MDWRKLLKRLKAAGLDPETIDSIKAAKTVGEVENILAAEMIELGQGVDLAQAWTTKKVTITADAGEDVEVITEPDGELAEDGEDDGEDDPMVGKSGKPRTRDLNKVDPRWAKATAEIRGANRGGPAVHTGASRAVKAYTRRSTAGVINPRTRKHYLFEDGESAEVAGAFMRLVAFGDVPALQDMYSRQKKIDHDIVGKAHGTNQAFAGAAFVTEELQSAIISLLNTGGAYRRAVGAQSMVGDTKYIRLDSDPVFSRVGEGNEIAAQNEPASSNVRLVADKIGAIARVSNELLTEAAVDVADPLVTSFARAQGIYEDKVGITGAIGAEGFQQKVGANSTYDATLATNWADYTSTKVQAWLGSLGNRAEEGEEPAIICSRQFYHTVLENLALSAGGTLSADRIRGVDTDFPGADALYNGRPVYFTSLMPGSYVADQFDAYTGFFRSAAKMGEVRGGLRIEQSEQRYFEFDEVAFRAVNKIAVNNHDVNNDADPLVVALKA
jgi:HK97 family phage major capsid protein